MTAVVFVQHQGRYLFPALAAIAAFFMLGLRQLVREGASHLGLPARSRLLEAVAMLGFDAVLGFLAVKSVKLPVTIGKKDSSHSA